MPTLYNGGLLVVALIVLALAGAGLYDLYRAGVCSCCLRYTPTARRCVIRSLDRDRMVCAECAPLYTRKKN